MQYHHQKMDFSSVCRSLNVFALTCLMILSCAPPMARSFPTTAGPLSTSYSDADILHNHEELVSWVQVLKGLHGRVFNEYRTSRFSPSASCAGLKVQGLPQHHRLGSPILEKEADLLLTHHRFVERYIEAMAAVTVDEYLYEGRDNFIHREESFITVENTLERVKVFLNAQLSKEGLENTGIVLLTLEDFEFVPLDSEQVRNIRVLCVLEDLHKYLSILDQHVTLLRNMELAEQGSDPFYSLMSQD